MTATVTYPDIKAIHWPSVIRHYRLSRGLKQMALAEDLGVTQTMVSRWEAGNAEPSARIQDRLFDMFWAMGSTIPQDAWLDRLRRHPAVIGVIDSRGCQIAASRGMLRSFRIERSEIEGRFLHEAFRGDCVKLFDRLSDSGFFEGRVASAESVDRLHMKRADGSSARFWAHGLHRPVFMKARQIFWLASGAAVSETVARDMRDKLGGPMVIRRAI